MGKSISIAIDYNSYENRVIENYLRDNADRIIRSLKLILIGMSRDTPLGLCGQLSMWMVREDYEVFKVWFTPDRFGIEGYPFKKYAIPYIFILVVWFIIFLYGLVS